MLSLIIAACLAQPSPDQLLDAHVRVIVEPVGERARYFGSGVVVFTQPGYTEILTCRHNVAGRGEIKVRIEDNNGDANRFKSAKIPKDGISYAKDCDLAIIRVHGAAAAAGAARIPPYGYNPVSPVMTVGSDLGKEPSIWAATIESLDREEHSESGGRVMYNMRIRHTSEQGRSGGGVYDAAGYLVGIIWGSLEDDGLSRAVNLTRVKTSPMFAEVQARSLKAAQAVPAQPQFNPNAPLLAGTPVVQRAVPRVLFFHRSSDPLALLRAAFGPADVQFLNAESDAEAMNAAKIWGIQSFPAAMAVVPNPDGSYRSLGKLYGSGITLEALGKMSSSN